MFYFFNNLRKQDFTIKIMEGSDDFLSNLPSIPDIEVIRKDIVLSGIVFQLMVVS